MQAPATSALSTRTEAADAARELSEQLGDAALRAIVFFCSHAHDGAALSAALRERYPEAQVIGCTTAGEFNQTGGGLGGVSALAFGSDRVRACHAALADFSGGVEPAISAAAGEIGDRLGIDLRAADSARYAALVLVEGLHGREEAANHALGMAAPALGFVGGSAADDLSFERTRVFVNGRESEDGAALLVMEMAVPFTVLKTCHLEPTEHHFTVTRADAAARTVYEVGGRPVLAAYAEAAGTELDALDFGVFMQNPWGMMLDGEPWIRSPKHALPDGGLVFACAVEEGMQMHLMRRTDLVAETRRAMNEAIDVLGGTAGGGLIFNCVYRRLEMDALSLHEPFLRSFDFPMAGFHTYGESYLGHMNQTCTGLVFA
ncbi:MAG: FIST C-terminal domain-containing protein [Gemmatimonadota bacterium]|nr:FIST C-terminal domain-containing protein [Gemmatimonadota bacterium]